MHEADRFGTKGAGRSSHRLDVLVMGALVLVSLALYGALAYRLAQGRYLDYFNLAFDFDPIRTVHTLAASPPDLQNVKHPLIVLLRPLATPLLMVGLTPKESAALVMALFGSGTIALSFIFLRQAQIERPIAAALTVLLIVSGAQIFTSMIVESYGFAGFGLAATWVITQARLSDASRFRGWRYAAGVFTLGVTMTNVVQTFIAELAVGWRWLGPGRALRQCVVFGILLALPILVLSLLVWHGVLGDLLKDPLLAIKEVYWEQPSGPKTPAWQVPLTFFTYSFVSPHYSWLMLPEGINMRDFRAYDFPPVGQVAAPLWLLFCAIGTVAGLCHRNYRRIATAIAIALLFNLVFHLRFQYRGSLYIYAAHMYFLIFALASGVAPWLSARRWSGKAYIGVVLALAVLIGADNLPIAAEFVTDFDQVDVPCAAPC